MYARVLAPPNAFICKCVDIRQRQRLRARIEGVGRAGCMETWAACSKKLSWCSCISFWPVYMDPCVCIDVRARLIGFGDTGACLAALVAAMTLLADHTHTTVTVTVAICWYENVRHTYTAVSSPSPWPWPPHTPLGARARPHVRRYAVQYVQNRRHQHMRAHAHTGPRRHARAPACRRHHISHPHGLSACPHPQAGRHSTRTVMGSPLSLCVCGRLKAKAGKGGGGEEARKMRVLVERQRSDVQQQARDRQAHPEGRREVGMTYAEVEEAVGRGLRMEPGLVTPRAAESAGAGGARWSLRLPRSGADLRRCFWASGRRAA